MAKPGCVSAALVASYCSLTQGGRGGTVLVSNIRSLLPQTPEMSRGLNGASFNCATFSTFLLFKTQRGHGRQPASDGLWAKTAEDKINTVATAIQTRSEFRITVPSSATDP